ncbi:hypothetical protein ACP70R_018621 [Stipagrostis hirtigluma subsp. patula]
MQYTLPLLNMQAPLPHTQSSKPQHHQQPQLMRTVSISILVMSLPVLYVSFLHVPPASLFRDTTFWFLMSNSIIIVIAADSGMLFFRTSSSSSTVDTVVDDNLPFVVSGDEHAAGKNGHASTDAFVSGEVFKNQALVVRDHGDLTVVAENDQASYALVVRDEQWEHMASTPESRDRILSPSFDAGEVVTVENADAATVRARPTLTASRSLARRRHGQRPPSQSRALVPVQDKSVVVCEEKRQLRRVATEGRPAPPAAAAEAEEERESEYSRLSDEELNRRVEEFITRFNREIRLQLEKEQAGLTHASMVHA